MVITKLNFVAVRTETLNSVSENAPNFTDTCHDFTDHAQNPVIVSEGWPSVAAVSIITDHATISIIVCEHFFSSSYSVALTEEETNLAVV